MSPASRVSCKLGLFTNIFRSISLHVMGTGAGVTEFPGRVNYSFQRSPSSFANFLQIIFCEHFCSTQGRYKQTNPEGGKGYKTKERRRQVQLEFCRGLLRSFYLYMMTLGGHRSCIYLCSFRFGKTNLQRQGERVRIQNGHLCASWSRG